MTGSELLFYIGLLIFCGLVMAWILIYEHRKQIKAETGGTEDRDRVLDMLAGVKDQASMAIYKKVYGIKDKDIADKKRESKN